uniref:Uncharacterized protein n=1 Tax=Salix viminalis TaxID=40686 RepID=A0A6N2K1X3_SALVM
MGEKRGELSGADKKRKGLANKMRGATRGLPRSEGGEADRRRILPGVSGGRFPCSSYGIATVTAGSLEFQDFIRALVEAALVNSGTKYRVDCGGGAWSDFGAGGLRRKGRGQTSVRVE